MNYNIIQNYWDKQPCNSKHSNLDPYSLEYFDEIIKKRRFVEKHNLEFLDPQRWNNKTVLEIGCGIGIDAFEFIKHGALYTGVDLSTTSVEFCIRNLQLHNLNGNIFNCNFEEENQNIKSNYFDLVYSYGVIHHSINPELIIKQTRRVIKNTGEFKFMVYSSDSWKDILVRNKLDQYEAQDNCPVVRTYTKEQIELLLKNYFNITNIERTFIFPFKLEEYKKNEYVYEPWFNAMPKHIFNCLEKEMGMHYLVTAKPI